MSLNGDHSSLQLSREENVSRCVAEYESGAEVLTCTNPKWGYWTEGNRNIAGQGTC